MPGVVIDVGKSATRCWFAGTESSAEGLAPERAAGAGAGRLLAEGVRAAWRRHPASVRDVAIEQVAVGTTFLPMPAELDAAGAVLRTVWPDASIGIAEDGILAHAYALGRPGVVASVGTGSIVVGIDDAGRVSRVDGWGPDLGDRGSAWSVGVAGMRAACRQLDGVGDATALTSELADYLGSDLDLEAATRLLARADRVQHIAGFAVKVLACAAADDPVAVAIVDTATDDLIASVAAVADRVGSRQVAVVGGLTSDERWLTNIRDRCADRDLALQSAGLLSDFDAGTLLDDPYRSACAWTSSSQ